MLALRIVSLRLIFKSIFLQNVTFCSDLDRHSLTFSLINLLIILSSHEKCYILFGYWFDSENSWLQNWNESEAWSCDCITHWNKERLADRFIQFQSRNKILYRIQSILIDFFFLMPILNWVRFKQINTTVLCIRLPGVIVYALYGYRHSRLNFKQMIVRAPINTDKKTAASSSPSETLLRIPEALLDISTSSIAVYPQPYHHLTWIHSFAHHPHPHHLFMIPA